MEKPVPKPRGVVISRYYNGPSNLPLRVFLGMNTLVLGMYGAGILRFYNGQWKTVRSPLFDPIFPVRPEASCGNNASFGLSLGLIQVYFRLEPGLFAPIFSE